MHLETCGLRQNFSNKIIHLKSTISPTTLTKVKMMCSGVKDHKSGQ